MIHDTPDGSRLASIAGRVLRKRFDPLIEEFRRVHGHWPAEIRMDAETEADVDAEVLDAVESYERNHDWAILPFFGSIRRVGDRYKNIPIAYGQPRLECSSYHPQVEVFYA